VMKVIDLASSDFLICQPSIKLDCLEKELMIHDEKLVILYESNAVVNVFTSTYILKEIIKLSSSNQHAVLANLKSNYTYSIVQEDSSCINLTNVLSDVLIVVDKNNYPVGVIKNVKIIGKIVEYLESTNKETKDKLYEYQKIIECLEEEVFVTDDEGCIAILNPMAEKVNNITSSEAIGKNIKIFEKNKVFFPSVTLEVIRKKSKVNIMQKMKDGRTLIGTGVPIFDEQGNLFRIISTSKDLVQINKLKEEIGRKDQELDMLREEMFGSTDVIFSSKVMQGISETLSKIAPTDLTVLIEGESGVGKEIIAKTIYNLSTRKKQPFVKINCGNLPETLLESDLFGYESGAFTGANKNGKIGKIELANHGTLFLDEIGEIPLSLQVKLLDLLQDKVITRVGGTAKIKIDARIIAATNRDLQEMVDEGNFRKDLFYRLNVMPIYIPGLRNRREAIPALVESSLRRFNKKYKSNQTVSNEVMDAFINYNWPGNIRELEHIVERLVVINDKEIIGKELLPGVLGAMKDTGKVICTELMPLKQAKKDLEKQLVKRAYDLYKSTYKVAKILNIDQSTVVKIMKKHGMS
jgi:transcriptional regulator with PAS, ATPase and Fis domain